MRVLISNGSNEPIYTQIYNQIKGSIVRGDIDQGELLPSIRGLAKDLQISVITTKRAYEELEKDGFLETIPGKGTYVAIKNMELLRELKLRIIEEALEKAVHESRMMGLDLDELQDMMRFIYEEDQDA